MNDASIGQSTEEAPMAVDPKKLSKLGDDMMAVGCGLTLLVFGIIVAIFALGTCFR